MAVTGTFTADVRVPQGTVVGNLRAVVGSVTMTDGPGDFALPLSTIIYCAPIPRSDKTPGGITFSGGTVSVASAASGGVFGVFALGV